MNNKIWKIFLVEDNPGDIRLIKEALREVDLPHHLDVMTDGSAVEEVLRSGWFQRSDQTPDLVILDLNLPGISGHHLLNILKNHQHYKTIPVVIFSSSSAEADILESYQNHANCYITKPVDFHNYLHIIQETFNFWFLKTRLPAVS